MKQTRTKLGHINATQKRLYELEAEVLAAAGHPIRLAIVEFLTGGEECVCDIAAHVGAERSNVSRHLAVLLRAGICEHRKDGLRMMYSLKTLPASSPASMRAAISCCFCSVRVSAFIAVVNGKPFETAS